MQVTQYCYDSDIWEAGHVDRNKMCILTFDGKTWKMEKEVG